MPVYLHKQSHISSLFRLRYPIKANNGERKPIEFRLLPPGPTFLRNVGDLLFKILYTAYETYGRTIIANDDTIDEAVNRILKQLVENNKVVDKICEVLNIDNIPLALHGLEHMLRLMINHDVALRIFEIMSANNLVAKVPYENSSLYYYAYLNRLRFARTLDLKVELLNKNIIYNINTTWTFKGQLILSNIEVETYVNENIEHASIEARPNGTIAIKYHCRRDIPYLPLYDIQEYDSYESFLAEVYSIMLSDLIDKVMLSYKELLQFFAITRFHPSTEFGVHLGSKSYLFLDANHYIGSYAIVPADDNLFKVISGVERANGINSLDRYPYSRTAIPDIIEQNLQRNCDYIDARSANWIKCYDRIQYLELIHHTLAIPADIEKDKYSSYNYDSPLFDISIHPIYQHAVTILQQKYPKLHRRLEWRLKADLSLAEQLRDTIANIIDWLYKTVSHFVHINNFSLFQRHKNYIENSKLRKSIESWLKAVDKYLQTNTDTQADHKMLANSLILLAYYLEFHAKDTKVGSHFAKYRMDFLWQLEQLRETALAKILLQLKAIAC